MAADKRTKKLFGGTLSLDEGIKILSRPGPKRVAYIINLSPSWHSGSHWVALWINGKKLEYFCSFGLRPPVGLHKVLTSRDARYKRNKRQIQSLTTDLCGEYCMVYILSKSKRVTFRKFLNFFTKNTKVNDKILSKVWNSLEIGMSI